MLHFKVKLKKQDDSVCSPDGYLGGENTTKIYTRGEALKKARMFGGGTLEIIPLSKVLTPVSMIQIPRNALLYDVERLLEGREMFVDADLTIDEKIYSGCVFQNILSEQDEDNVLPLSKKAIQQLDELAQMCNSDYIQITNN